MIVLCCTHFTQIFVCTHCLCSFGSINEMVYILKKVALLSMYNLIYNDITCGVYDCSFLRPPSETPIEVKFQALVALLFCSGCVFGLFRVQRCSSDMVVCVELVKVLVFVMKLVQRYLFISRFRSGPPLALLIIDLPGLLFLSDCPRCLPFLKQYNESEAPRLPDEGVFELSIPSIAVFLSFCLGIGVVVRWLSLRTCGSDEIVVVWVLSS
ncbi:BnaC05g23290D [Brassica napus]|uniref:(rape) hypothetical protein n=1 Tax=Brassica napus TaxID=3708 RepID=A0A078F590_BRANA|nr:unnamed protein product [Brassica napus]CDY09590.1 BnaC05g23290D [Brassica napus]